MIRETKNEKLVKAIREKLAKDSHCPCQKEKSDDTICPCKSFQEQKEGFCHCGLFEKIPDEKRLTQYELAKNVMAQMPALTKEQIENGKEKFKEYLEGLSTTTIAMINRDKYDFTVFNMTEKTADVILLALKNRGEIIDFGGEDAWVRVDGEVLLYKVFDGDSMFVVCNEIEVG